MTAKDIEKLFQEELGLYEFVDIRYNEETKEFYMQIKMDFSKEYSHENPLFEREVFNRTNMNEELEFISTKLPTLIFTIENGMITAEISSLLESKLFDITKRIFEDYLHEWGII